MSIHSGTSEPREGASTNNLEILKMREMLDQILVQKEEWVLRSDIAELVALNETKNELAELKLALEGLKEKMLKR